MSDQESGKTSTEKSDEIKADENKEIIISKDTQSTKIAEVSSKAEELSAEETSVLVEKQFPLTNLSIESVLLDADLFLKYQSAEKAFELLRTAIERSPRSIPLREKMREICIATKNFHEAARQCLALVSLYITKEDFDLAYDRLQEAKLLDPRISVAPGLEAIRRARRPIFNERRERSSQKVRTDVALAGDLSLISIFDAIQVIENSKLTGLLVIKSDVLLGSVAFNEGKIVDAEANGKNGISAFREIIEISRGVFEFSTSENEFQVVIQVSNNTTFLLDLLTELEAEKARKEGLID
jgi:tetratricopeptide (TPR) repeat protein